MKKIALVGGSAVLGIGLALVIAFENRGDPVEPGLSGAEEFAQKASAEANGITIASEWATYSGTETVLGLRVTSSETGDAAAIEIPAAAVTGEGALGTLPATSRLDENGAWAVVMPPLSGPGTWQLTVEYVFLRDDAGNSKMEGPWVLDIEGPPAQRFDEVMRVERLASVSIDMLGHSVTVTGLRSTTRTILRYSPPPGWRELSPPRIQLADGTLVLPRTSGDEGSALVAEFNPTAFGSPVQFQLGSFAQPGSEGSVLEVRLASALQRAGVSRDEHGQAPILDTDIIDGPGNILQSAGIQRHEQGSGGRPAHDAAPPPGEFNELMLTLRGSWHPQDDPGGDPLRSTPGIIDANGKRLWMTYIGTGYSKTSDGTVREGRTDAAYYLPDDANLETVTIVLGPPSIVVDGDWGASLDPLG